MPKTESEWQELSDFLAREVMGVVRWKELTEEERKAIKQSKVWRWYDGYWWPRGEGTLHPLYGILLWQPHNNIAQAMLILKTLLASIGHYAEAELHLRISPNRCRVTIQNWVATDGTPAGFVRSPYVDNEMQAICLAAKEWCDVQTAKTLA